MIDRLPEEEAMEVRKISRMVLAAAMEYEEHPIIPEKEKASSGGLKNINID